MLIKEINDLRKEVKLQRTHVHDLKATLGLYTKKQKKGSDHSIQMQSPARRHEATMELKMEEQVRTFVVWLNLTFCLLLCKQICCHIILSANINFQEFHHVQYAVPCYSRSSYVCHSNQNVTPNVAVTSVLWKLSSFLILLSSALQKDKVQMFSSVFSR